MTAVDRTKMPTVVAFEFESSSVFLRNSEIQLSSYSSWPAVVYFIFNVRLFKIDLL